MPIYPLMAVAAALVVVALELAVLRTGIFRQRAYWISLLIAYAFMIVVDGWLTKRSAPIVIYRARDVSGVRPIWDILIEEYAYAFALLTLVMLAWEWTGRARKVNDESP
jgi:lycopene cyclase domain-containing protein